MTAEERRISELCGQGAGTEIAESFKTIQRQLDALAEQATLAKAFPVAILDSQKLNDIIMSTARSYQTAINELMAHYEERLKDAKNEELKAPLLEINDKSVKILDLLEELRAGLVILQSTAALEREVLEVLLEKLRAT